MRTGTKMSNAIERIKGYCTEVNQAQWEELVRVADEVGVAVSGESRDGGTDNGMWGYAMIDLGNYVWSLITYDKCGELIPFTDYLAKLRGVEEWTPKAGEMVEVSGEDGHWHSAEYIGLSRDKHIVWTAGWTGAVVTEWPNCRPILPTITRAEAEQQLGKRIID